MDFLKMDFSKLFLEKFGRIVFEKIVEQIKNENKENKENDEIKIIFKIALLDYWGIEEKNIPLIIQEKIDIKKIKITHKNSINIIKEYIKNEVESDIANL